METIVEVNPFINYFNGSVTNVGVKHEGPIFCGGVISNIGWLIRTLTCSNWTRGRDSTKDPVHAIRTHWYRIPWDEIYEGSLGSGKLEWTRRIQLFENVVYRIDRWDYCLLTVTASLGFRDKDFSIMFLIVRILKMQKTKKTNQIASLKTKFKNLYKSEDIVISPSHDNDSRSFGNVLSQQQRHSLFYAVWKRKHTI